MGVNWTGILLIFVLVLINAFFAGSEIAVISTRRVKIQQLMEEGNTSARVLLKLIEDPSFFLATIQVGITLAGFLASATAAVGISTALASQFEELGIPSGIASTLGVFVVTIIISYLTLVFGELAPKRLAMQYSENIALKVARPINFIARVTTPITKFLTFSTNVVVRLLGGNPHQKEEEMSEEEIRLYIAEHQALPEEEKRMIEAVFDFGDQVVRQVMVPRPEIHYINADDSIKEAVERACVAKYSAFPVYQRDYENIIGVVNIHDLACRYLTKPEQKVKDIMSKTLFVPETKHTVELLKQFRKEKIRMAVVVDEYGGTVGLITLEDLVDEIIGDVIKDHHQISETTDGQWLVDGDTPIKDIADALKVKNFTPTGEYETIAGFILDKLGHLPMEGETVTWDGFNFQVTEMGARRIRKVLINAG